MWVPAYDMLLCGKRTRRMVRCRVKCNNLIGYAIDKPVMFEREDVDQTIEPLNKT
jgi:hypothetical protein